MAQQFRESWWSAISCAEFHVRATSPTHAQLYQGFPYMDTVVLCKYSPIEDRVYPLNIWTQDDMWCCRLVKWLQLAEIIAEKLNAVTKQAHASLIMTHLRNKSRRIHIINTPTGRRGAVIYSRNNTISTISNLQKHRQYKLRLYPSGINTLLFSAVITEASHSSLHVVEQVTDAWHHRQLTPFLRIL